MTIWSNTIQCFALDDIMSLGIKSSATDDVGPKNAFAQKIGLELSSIYVAGVVGLLIRALFSLDYQCA